MNLVKDEFVSWLKGKEPTDAVGYRTIVSTCPIATYLNETTGNRYSVNPFKYGLRDNGLYTELPEWAKDFVRAVDHAYNTLEDRYRVKASEALEILNEC